MIRYRLVLTFIMIYYYVGCLPLVGKAEYVSSDFCFIPWGDNPEQLRIEPPSWVDVNNTPTDSSDDLIEEPPGGPTQLIIDRSNNIFVSSSDLNYLKVFDTTGRLINDLSFGESNYESLLGTNSIGKLYVDSLSHIFILTFPPSEYLLVIDTAGSLVDTLNPLGMNTHMDLCAMFNNSKDIFSVSTCSRELYTYNNGEFIAG